MRRRGPALLALLLGLAAPAARAGEAGTTAYGFLNLGSSPRIEGLGEAGSALAEGVDAVVWNPARLGVSPRREASVSYFNWLDDVQAGHAGATFPLGRASVGLVVRSLSVTDFGNVPGEGGVGQSDLAVGAAAAYPLPGSLHLGAGVKVIRSSLAEEDATGWAGDVGLDYRWVEGWHAVAAVRNFGAAFGYVDGVDEKLPTQAAFGVGSRFGELLVDSEVLWEEGPGWGGALGAEYRLWQRLALRAGGRVGQESDRAAEPWAVGIGVAARRDLELEYSFRDGTFDASHRVGVRWTPGRSLGAPDEDLARSPREFYVDVLNEALDRSLVTFPTDVGDTVVVRSSATHNGARVISDVIAERLQARGLTVELADPAPVIPDSVDAATREGLAAQGIGVPPPYPLLEYEIRTSEYRILRSRRLRWVGPRSIDREAQVDLGFTLTVPGAEEPVWTAGGEAREQESVASSRVPTSAGYPRWEGTGVKGKKLHPLVEPAIVGGIVAGLAMIFFSNRDVGQ